MQSHRAVVAAPSRVRVPAACARDDGAAAGRPCRGPRRCSLRSAVVPARCGLLRRARPGHAVPARVVGRAAAVAAAGDDRVRRAQEAHVHLAPATPTRRTETAEPQTRLPKLPRLLRVRHGSSAAPSLSDTQKQRKKKENRERAQRGEGRGCAVTTSAWLRNRSRIRWPTLLVLTDHCMRGTQAPSA